jgi:hypothetical protein
LAAAWTSPRFLPPESPSLCYTPVMLGISLIGGVVELAALPPFLLASFTSPRSLATEVIEKRLRSLEIDPAGFSRQCIDALANEAIASAKWFHRLGIGRAGPWRSNLEAHAVTVADHVYAVVVGIGDFSAERIGAAVRDDAAPAAWRILARYDPERFGLANLDKTQWTNAMMRGRAT